MPFSFFLIAILVQRFVNGDWIDPDTIGVNSKLPFEHPILIWLIWIAFFGFGEETGWRGFLFPELDKANSSWGSAFLVAIIWGAWHLPLFIYDKDFIALRGSGATGWFLGLLFGSFLLSWLVKNARWRLWPVILWHGTFNFLRPGTRCTRSFKLSPAQW